MSIRHDQIGEKLDIVVTHIVDQKRWRLIEPDARMLLVECPYIVYSHRVGNHWALG